MSDLADDGTEQRSRCHREAPCTGEANQTSKIIVLRNHGCTLTAMKASDLPSTSRILVTIVTLCKDSGDFPLLNEQVQLLSKKHGQLRQAITKMVQVVMGFLDDAPSQDAKMSTIETLRTVTEGKIFVEVERARVTRILSDMKKEKGDIDSATEILCELQVETFGSMSRREKTEFILEQVSLCIQKGDWTQAGILSRKISTRYIARKPKKTAEELEKEKKEREEKEKKRGPDEAPPEPEDDVTDLKLRYYEQQITLAKHEDKYLEVCKNYRQVLDTEAVENNPERLRAVSHPSMADLLLLMTYRRCKGSYTSSFLPLTTTNNQIFCTVFSATTASSKRPPKLPLSSFSQSPSSCDGLPLARATANTFAVPTSSPLPKTRVIPKHTSAGLTSESESLSTTFVW